MIKTYNLEHTAANLAYNRKVYKNGLYELAKDSIAYKIALQEKKMKDDIRYIKNCAWLEKHGFRTAK